ncbi:MAG: helix-turn-helix domain-containing protein [Thermoguttaceae bacterium]
MISCFSNRIKHPHTPTQYIALSHKVNGTAKFSHCRVIFDVVSQGKFGGIEKTIRVSDKDVNMNEERLSDYVTIKQAAEMLNISVGTVRNEIKRGRLCVVRFGLKGRAVRVIRESISALIRIAKGGN